MALEWIEGLGWIRNDGSRLRPGQTSHSYYGAGPVETRILADSDHRIQAAEQADRLNRKLASLPWGRSVDWSDLT